MNKFITSGLLPILLCVATSSHATIWRLNNSNGGTLNPAINASFPAATTLQQAHDNINVQSGDTIHVEQSNTSYGPLTMTKQLVIIGPGYFLDKNPKTQVNTSYGATVSNIVMDAATCSGSVITGLTITGYVYAGANKITLMRNHFSSSGSQVQVGLTSALPTDSVVIIQNYMETGTNSSILVRTSGTGIITNLIIANNYIGSTGTGINASSRISGGLIKNNVLRGTMNVHNAYILNNIQDATGTNTINNSLIEYNLGKTANQFRTPTGANNTTNSTNNLVSTTLGFIGGGAGVDSAWKLQPASPANGAGKSGDDMGMYGGPLPYVLSGLPAVPNIYELSIAPVAAGATSISVTVSAKSN